jgi:hypothetical protein
MTDCTELLVVRDMQVDSLGQQKEDGKPAPHCWKSAIPPHVCACRERRLDACVGVRRNVKRQKTDIRNSRGDIMAGAIVLKPGKYTGIISRGQTGKPQ